MKRLLPVALSMVLLAACASQVATTDVPAMATTSVPSAAPTRVASSPTATATPHPTSTVAPTPTLWPSPTPEVPWQTVPSPDGKLTAKMYEDYWHSYSLQIIEVHDQQGEVVWAIPYQGQWPRGDPHSVMTIVGWSPDSSTLYFYYSFGYDGWYTLFNGSNLQALDLPTGKLKSLVSGCCVAFSFLPDMSTFVYTSAGRVGVYDIATGSDRWANIRSAKIDQAGQIHWSPGGTGAVFTVLMDEQTNAREIYLDVKSMMQTVLFEDFLENYWLDGWTESGNPRYVKLNLASDGAGSLEVIVVDIKTAASLVVGTVTPTPKP